MISIDDELHIPDLGLWLDARRPRPLSFVSHAHKDHMGAHVRAIATPATAALCRMRMPHGTRTDYETRTFGEAFLVGNASVELVPSGHVLGSSQIVVRNDGSTTVYTGDFKLRPGRTHERCAVPHCDTLIMECTYGMPRYRFPDRGQVEAELAARCAEALSQGKTPVIHAYSLGKSQEVISALNRARLPVMVHPAVADVSDVYRSLGVDVGPYKRHAGKAAAGHVVVSPPHVRPRGTNKVSGAQVDIAVTGWAVDRSAQHRLGVDLALPLSDHADFDELLSYVDKARPKRVFCVHGFPDFVWHLRRAGVDAQWLAPNVQLELFRI